VTDSNPEDPPSDEELARERQRYLDILVDNPAHLKAVVAGPGTGKTYTFGVLLRARPGDHLVLSFINNLVQDLAAKLGGIAEVRTFHQFARVLLHRHGPVGISHDVDYYPPLVEVFATDGTARLGHNISRWDVEGVMHLLDHGNDILQSVLTSGNYYNAVAHVDAVYRVVRHLEAQPGDIPAYGQIVVDEYQDFSALEVALIDQLATVSPTLIVGDDDQALYDFKHASPRFLRERALGGQYQRFELPYCTRCTEVLVQATNRTVERAQEAGLLQGRVDKRFICYTPDKRTDNERYPRILYVHTTVQNRNAPLMARYIAERIRQIPKEEVDEANKNGNPTVIVVGPGQFIARIYEYLSTEFEGVEYKRSNQPQMDLLAGYIRLLDDPRSRLGWRIVAPDGPAGWLRADHPHRPRAGRGAGGPLACCVSAAAREPHRAGPAIQG
jgi:ATP-dependent DNA helicase UvrD/PcrA